MDVFKVGDQVKLVGHGTRDSAMRIKAISRDQVRCEWDAYEVTQDPGSRLNTYQLVFPANLLRLVSPVPAKEMAEATLKDLKPGPYISIPEPLAAGDVVRLKSGGPLMTVAGVYPNGLAVDCMWFDAQDATATSAGSAHSQTFVAACLKRVDIGPVQPKKWRDETAPIPKAANEPEKPTPAVFTCAEAEAYIAWLSRRWPGYEFKLSAISPPPTGNPSGDAVG